MFLKTRKFGVALKYVNKFCESKYLQRLDRRLFCNYNKNSIHQKIYIQNSNRQKRGEMATTTAIKTDPTLSCRMRTKYFALFHAFAMLLLHIHHKKKSSIVEWSLDILHYHRQKFTTLIVVLRGAFEVVLLALVLTCILFCFFFLVVSVLLLLLSSQCKQTVIAGHMDE